MATSRGSAPERTKAFATPSSRGAARWRADKRKSSSPLPMTSLLREPRRTRTATKLRNLERLPARVRVVARHVEARLNFPLVIDQLTAERRVHVRRQLDLAIPVVRLARDDVLRARNDDLRVEAHRRVTDRLVVGHWLATARAR